MENEQELDKTARAELLAERIKLLFMFVTDLEQYRDLLEEAKTASAERASFAMSAAPLFGAMGVDWEAQNFEHRLYAKRAGAILKLLDTLKETENEREEFTAKQSKVAEGRAMLMSIMGDTPPSAEGESQ